MKCYAKSSENLIVQLANLPPKPPFLSKSFHLFSCTGKTHYLCISSAKNKEQNKTFLPFNFQNIGRQLVQYAASVNKESARVNSRFIISFNRNQERIVQFHTICHELGHLFCYHQFYTESKRRKLTIKEREFEAETVAWLVCKRHGIYNPSEEYLASYAPQGEIPICSTDLIMKAVAEIERMMESPIKIKESLWYKEDKGLKEKIRVIERQQKGPDLFA